MRELFNSGWLFAMTSADENAKPEGFRSVDIPHDWLIYDTNALYETSFGHYKKEFDFGDIEGKSVRLYFEGVYMDCTVYVNSIPVCDNKYGYSSFEADLTPALHSGINTVEVKVRHRAPNTRWYSGAGIFRDVWLISTPKAHLATDGVYFHAEKRGGVWNCSISAETVGAAAAEVSFTLSNGEKILCSGSFSAENTVNAEFTLADVSESDIWDIEHPNLLTLSSVLSEDGTELDRITQRVGLREASFDPDKGFLLNGRRVKLHGVCLHHDLGCLGAAFNRSAEKRRLLEMKEMGVNSIRTSHNMPAAAFMELCDELGVLVDSEAFDMWERPKTEFDYARFFDDWFEKDVASWVRRDRNHPSVIMWSIGNEIYDTHASPRGCEVAEMLHNAVRKHDPLSNAPTTTGSNYMQWEGAQNSARKVDLAGYNYGEFLYENHHKANPDWCIYGSETTAGVKSRGVYHFPLKAAFLTHEDLQCSSLGNCRAGISAMTAQKVIALDRDTDFCAGMYLWTGSDYIGEPSPYSTKNAYYGSIDTAGIRKDSFYLYRAAWTNEPVLHLMPYWDFNDGQLVDAVVYTNLKEVELFLNGRSLGKKAPEEYTAAWELTYETGELKAVGIAADGKVYEDIRHSFGESAEIKLTAGRQSISADGEDIAVIEVSTVDKDGYPVENARDRVRIEVVNGRLLGFDNGDSTDYDQYKSASRRLFSGKAAAYTASAGTGTMTVRAFAPGLGPAELTIALKPAGIRSGAAVSENITASPDEINSSDIPVRKIELTRSGGSKLTPGCAETIVSAKILPENATYDEIKFAIVTDSGIAANTAEITENKGRSVRIAARGDGSFRLRCTCNNGKPQAEVISDYEFTAEGFGRASLYPYEPVPACLHSDSISVMDEVAEGGVNITPDNNIVGFRKTDFGKYGTDSFTVRVINWFKNDPFGFRLWLGYPNAEGSRKIGDYTYQADFVWQTYIENSYTLPFTLKGEQELYFEFDKTDMRINFGGFRFDPRLKAYEVIAASDCDLIHGDNYGISGGKVINIGNNVFIDYADMCFEHGTSELAITGMTRHDNDSVHVKFSDGNGVVHQTVFEFRKSSEPITVSQKLPDMRGNMTLGIAFLPGCDFDLCSLQVSRLSKK